MTTLDSAAVDALLERARREVDDGLLPACQIALGLDGKVVLHEVFGDADLDTRYTIFSATKAFVASVVWQLIGEGLLDPATPSPTCCPSFGANGKDAITARPRAASTRPGSPSAPLGPPPLGHPRGSGRGLRRVAAQLGRRAPQFEYHPTSAHWVLAELIHAVTGEDHTDAVRTRVAEPARASPAFTLGVAADDNGGIAELSAVGEPATPDELEAALGVREIDVGEVTEDGAPAASTAPRRGRWASPAAGPWPPPPTSPPSTRPSCTTRRASGTPACSTDVTSVVRNTLPRPDARPPGQPDPGLDPGRRRRPVEPARAWAAPSRPVPSATTAPAARSPGPTRPPACPSAT